MNKLDAEFYPEIPLHIELERQAKRYQELGFPKHKALRVSDGQFKDLVLKLASPQPKEFKGRLDIPAVVFGQVPVGDQCKMAGFQDRYMIQEPYDWPSDTQHYHTPKSAYLAWTDGGARIKRGKVMDDVRKELAIDERGGTVFDGVAFYISHPNIIGKLPLFLPGTVTPASFAALYVLSDGTPELGYRYYDSVDDRFSYLICGRQK